MRVAVVGAGVAGALLARRLAPRAAVTVFTGPGPDATAVSGGLTRAFEPDAQLCRLAAESVAELLALPDDLGFVRTGSVYVLPSADGLDVPLKELEDRLPGFARVEAPTWRGLPAGAVAVVEERAGYLVPDRLRAWALRDLPVEPAVPLASLTGYDAVVLATGRWTPALLAAAGLPSPFRTKSIQYGLFPASSWTPPAFVDGVSGLWGRPAGPRSVLLGVPSERWDPVALTPEPELVAASVAAVRDRFGVVVGAPTTVVASADAYADPPVLALRPVGGRPGLFTFTGGSGGAAKYALAASRAAAAGLLG